MFAPEIASHITEPLFIIWGNKTFVEKFLDVLGTYVASCREAIFLMRYENKNKRYEETK